MNLIEGYFSFRKNTLPHIQDRLKEFEKGQSPHTLFITCSDSRIDPHLITNSSPGELFIIRNAGNYIAKDDNAESESSVMSTLEFAINVLGISNIIICGHTDCGAVKSATANLSETYFLKSYIPKFNFAADTLNRAIELNILAQITKLKSITAFKEKDLTIHAWKYNVSTGDLRVLDETKNAFIDMKEGA